MWNKYKDEWVFGWLDNINIFLVYSVKCAKGEITYAKYFASA